MEELTQVFGGHPYLTRKALYLLAVEKQSDIPELNIYQCGTCAMHSLEDAKAIATEVLRKDIDIMDNEALKLDMRKVNG